MSRPQRNDTDIEAERTWFTWDAYDALPPLLRRVLANSPYDLGCGWLVEDLRGGGVGGEAGPGHDPGAESDGAPRGAPHLWPDTSPGGA